jgi:hypothetical protein
MHGCRQRPAKVACVQAYIHLFATPVCPIPEYATGTSTALLSSTCVCWKGRRHRRAHLSSRWTLPVSRAIIHSSKRY